MSITDLGIKRAFPADIAKLPRPTRRALRRIEHWHDRAEWDLRLLGADDADLDELEAIIERLRWRAVESL